jgi:hypothetical protein
MFAEDGGYATCTALILSRSPDAAQRAALRGVVRC